jgi:hypothetical protein
MLSVIAKSRPGTGALVAVALLGAGFALQTLAAPAWARLRTGRMELPSAVSLGALGQGTSLSVLGGWRAVAADFAWLRVNAAWERRDLPATQTAIRLVTTIDPRPLVFWLNGARMLAYDMPDWRIEAAGGYDRVPAAVQARIAEEQAALGLRLLDDALIQHPNLPALFIEQAGIHFQRRHDFAAAATYYRRAAEQPGAPYFAARIYAELLRRLGRTAEAYAWLVQLHPTLPRDVEAAQADDVLARIRELETRLNIPPASAYRPPAGR